MVNSDLLDIEIEIECEGCNKPLKVTLKQVKSEETIFCPNCNAEIKLSDENHSIQSIEEQLKNFGIQ